MKNGMVRRVTATLCVTLVAFGTTFGCKGRLPNFLSKSDEVKLGQQGAQEVEAQSRILTSGPEAERLARVAMRIIRLARQDYEVPYTVKLIDSPEINAFAMPGGPIYFYKGLVSLADSDDEVAAVLGHEATHITKRHSAKQISDQMGKSALAAIVLGNSGQTAQTIAGLGLQIEQLKFGRNDESQADQDGFHYLVEAGYNPDAMASFFRKMAQKGGSGGGPEWLQSHPLTNRRIETTQRYADEYKQSGKLP